MIDPSKNVPLRVSLLYLLLGAVWIFLSDISMVWIGVFDQSGYLISFGKGILFVIVSSIAIYLLLRQQLAQVHRANLLAHAVIHGATDAVFVKDRRGRYLMFNQAAARCVGKQAEEVIGHDDYFIFDASAAKAVIDRDQKIMESGEVETAEEELSIANSVRVYSATKFPYRDANGNVIGLIGFSRDVTEKIEADKQLRLERDRLSSIVDAVPVIICTFQSRPDGTFSLPFSSARIESIYGISREELMVDASPVFDRVHPDDRDRVVESVTASARDMTIWECDYRVCRPGLDDIWVEGRSAPSRQEDGSILWHGYVADITARKRDQEAYQATEHRLEHAQSIAKMGSWTWEPPTNRVWWSNETFELYGLDPKVSVPSFQHFLDRLDPNDQKIAIERVDALMNGADGFSNEFFANRIDGSKVWLLSVARATRDAQGRLLHVDGFDQDISGRKQIEEELRLSEERLRLALRSAGGGVWDWNLQTDQAWWSPEMYALWGVDPSEPMKLSNSLAAIHEQDRELVRVKSQRAIETKSGYHAEFRITHPERGECWIASRGKAVADRDGVMRLIGISQDITDRMHTENALRESELRFRNLVTMLPDAVGIIIGEKLVFHNPALLRLLGIEDSQAFLDKPYSCIFPEDVLDTIHNQFADLPASETSHLRFETDVRRIDGRRVCVQLIASRITDRSLESILVVLHDLSEQKRVEMQIRHQELILREAAEMAHVGGWSFTPVTGEMKWTTGVVQIHEPEDESPKTVQWTLQRYEGEDRERLALAMQSATDYGTPFDLELSLHFKHGTKFVRKICHPVVEQGKVILVRGALQDITDRRRLEDHLRQSQKMEAVGRLAGGVAHDFNNLLTVINGYCRMLVEQTSESSDIRSSLLAIEDAADRATRLTRQLLSFSRKAMVEFQVLDLNAIIIHAASLLRRLVGQDISLELALAPTSCFVEADAIQIDQVILNLTVNARDASQPGGVVTIATRCVELSMQRHTTTGVLRPGKYVELTVSDHGSGMSDSVKAKVFEPFFSTKQRDKGSGLGLSVVHGIVTQTGGQIDVESEPEQGSRFRVYFKHVSEPAEHVRPIVQAVHGGKETILIVEDEDAIRVLCQRTLQSQGYQVLAAADGNEAIELFNEAVDDIDILVTDLTMPKMGGRELAENLQAKKPQLLVLYISGYSDDVIIQQGIRDGVDTCLQKPFLPAELAVKVRELLDNS